MELPGKVHHLAKQRRQPNLPHLALRCCPLLGWDVFLVCFCLHSSTQSRGKCIVDSMQGSSTYTLLPGYVSRPNPSPSSKRMRMAAPSQPDGDFVATYGAATGQPLNCQPLSEGGEKAIDESLGNQQGKGSVDAVWADLAQELHRSQERVSNRAADVPADHSEWNLPH